MGHTDVSRSIRSAVFAGLDIVGLPQLFLNNSPRIVLYHGVTDEQGDGIFNYRKKFVPTAAFKAHVDWYKERFTILPLEEFVARFASGTLPPRSLAITFDDGYANNYAEAYPILRAAGVPATFFVTTGFAEGLPLSVDIIEYALGMTKKDSLTVDIGNTKKVFALGTCVQRIRADLALRSHMKTLPVAEAKRFIEHIAKQCDCDLRANLMTTPYRPMTWDHMREMEQNGMTFAPHTRTHPILSRCSYQEAKEEILGSKQTLDEQLARPLHMFAYPNGGTNDYTDETQTILREAGCTASLTTTPRTLRNTDSLLGLPRFTLDGADDMHRARLTVSGLYGRLRFLA